MPRPGRNAAPFGAVPLLIADCLLMAGSFAAAWRWVMLDDPEIFFLAENGWFPLLLAAGGFVGMLYFQNLYSRADVASRIGLAQQLAQVAGANLLVQSVLHYLVPSAAMPVMWMLAGTGVFLAAALVWRIVFATLAQQTSGARPLLFVGADPVFRAIAWDVAEHPFRGYSIAGFLSDSPAAVSETEAPLQPDLKLGKTSRLGGLTDLARVAAEWPSSRIVVATELLDPSQRTAYTQPDQELVGTLLRLRLSGREVERSADCYEQIFRMSSLAELTPFDLLVEETFQPTRKRSALAELLERAAALGLAILLSPLIGLVAGAIMFAAGRLRVRRQVCQGMGGRTFQKLSLRLVSHAIEPPLWAQFLVGRSLVRNYPALWNIAQGNMAFIGPAPRRVAISRALMRHLPPASRRFHLKPGLMGWSGVTASPSRPRNAWEETECELYYLRHRSSSLDIYVLLRSLKMAVQ